MRRTPSRDQSVVMPARLTDVTSDVQRTYQRTVEVVCVLREFLRSLNFSQQYLVEGADFDWRLLLLKPRATSEDVTGACGTNRLLT